MLKTLYLFNRLTGISTGQEDEIMLKKDKSEALTKEYNKYYPGGHSNLRIPMDVTEHRLFIAKSDGTHLTDVDGNEYIEYNGSMGPNILGHKNPNFVKKSILKIMVRRLVQICCFRQWMWKLQRDFLS